MGDHHEGMSDAEIAALTEKMADISTTVRSAVLGAVMDVVKEMTKDADGFDQDGHYAIMLGIGAALGDMGASIATVAQPPASLRQVLDTVDAGADAARGWAIEQVKKHKQKADED